MLSFESEFNHFLQIFNYFFLPSCVWGFTCVTFISFLHHVWCENIRFPHSGWKYSEPFSHLTCGLVTLPLACWQRSSAEESVSVDHTRGGSSAVWLKSDLVNVSDSHGPSGELELSADWCHDARPHAVQHSAVLHFSPPSSLPQQIIWGFRVNLRPIYKFPSLPFSCCCIILFTVAPLIWMGRP